MVTSQNKFLFLSDSDPEGATSRLAVAGIVYIKKKLESGRANWASVNEIMDREPLAAALVKLTNPTMLRMTDQEFETVADQLLARLAKIPHAVFVHASFFDRSNDYGVAADDGDDEWFGSTGHFTPLEHWRRRKIMDMLEHHGIESVPYRRNVELSVLASRFVDDHRANLLFRFYVPGRRIWAEQTCDLLGLFRDYLVKALGFKVQLATHSTSNGTTYEFFGDGVLTADLIKSQYATFVEIIALCLVNPEAAEHAISAMGVGTLQAERLVTQFSVKARRVELDARQGRNRLVMELSDALEHAALDQQMDLPGCNFRTIIDSMVPTAERIAQVSWTGAVPTDLSAVRNLTINLNPVNIGKVHGLVAQAVSGTQLFGAEARNILERIEEEGGDQKGDLRSAIHLVEDDEASPDQKLGAGNRILAFLSKIGGKALEKVAEHGAVKSGEFAIHALSAYVTLKMGQG